MHQGILLLHVLGATIWTGGHLVLAITVLPRALRAKDPSIVEQFEGGYEKLGMPALVLQLLTGLWLAYRLLPDPGAWFAFGSPAATNIFAKVILLARHSSPERGAAPDPRSARHSRHYPVGAVRRGGRGVPHGRSDLERAHLLATASKPARRVVPAAPRR
jgi:hypothetical protein